jgi:hypothetical protein
MTHDHAPIVHLNGSGERHLLENYSNAIIALRDAQKAMAESYPHMRDYYILKDGAERFHRADDAHMARLRKVEEIIAEFEALGAAVIEQSRE